MAPTLQSPMDNADFDAVRQAVVKRLEGDFDLHHITLQTERSACESHEAVHP